MLTESQIQARRVLAELSGRRLTADRIDPGMTLADDLEIDSLQMLRLVLELEEALGHKVFDVEALAGLHTVADLDRVLEGGSERRKEAS